MDINIKKFAGFIILALLLTVPMYSAHAQEALDDQFMGAAIGLDKDARAEFVALIRDPEVLEDAFDALGIDHPKLADRIEKKLESLNSRHNTDHALETLDRVTDTVGAHLERLANQHAGKSRKALENALARRNAGLAKAKAAVAQNRGPANTPAANNNPGNGVIGGGNGGSGGGGVGNGGSGGVGNGGGGGVGNGNGNGNGGKK